MNTVIDSAHSWFFDSAAHELDGSLHIYLAEGIKGEVREFVSVGDQQLGPYFSVKVTKNSRCAKVVFDEVLAFFVFDERFFANDPERLVHGPGKFIVRVTQSTFRKFCLMTTTIEDLRKGQYQEFMLYCEDRVFQVVAAFEPRVELLETPPDMTKERSDTWASN